jgi:hypothetical protein
VQKTASGQQAATTDRHAGEQASLSKSTSSFVRFMLEKLVTDCMHLLSMHLTKSSSSSSTTGLELLQCKFPCS